MPLANSFTSFAPKPAAPPPTIAPSFVGIFSKPPPSSPLTAALTRALSTPQAPAPSVAQTFLSPVHAPPTPAPLTRSILNAQPVMGQGSTVLPTPSQPSPGTSVTGLLTSLSRFSQPRRPPPGALSFAPTHVEASGWFASPVATTARPSAPAYSQLAPFNPPTPPVVPVIAPSLFSNMRGSRAGMTPAPPPAEGTPGTPGGIPAGADLVGGADPYAYVDAPAETPAAKVVGIDWQKVALWGGAGLVGLFVLSRMMRPSAA